MCTLRTAEFYHGHCWNDLLVVKRRGCGKRVLFERILPNASRDRNRLLKGGRKAAANTTGNSYTFPECHCF